MALHGTAKHLAYPPSRLALEHLQLLEVPAARKPAAARRAPKRPLYPQHLQVAHTAQGAHGALVGRLGSGGFGSFRKARKFPGGPEVSGGFRRFPGRALTPFSRTMSRVNGRDGPSSCRSQQPEFSAANMMSCNETRGLHAACTRKLRRCATRCMLQNALVSDPMHATLPAATVRTRNKGLGVRARPGRTGS